MSLSRAPMRIHVSTSSRYFLWTISLSTVIPSYLIFDTGESGSGPPNAQSKPDMQPFLCDGDFSSMPSRRYGMTPARRVLLMITRRHAVAREMYSLFVRESSRMTCGRYRKTSGEKDCPSRVAADRNNKVEADSWVRSVESCRSCKLA